MGWGIEWAVQPSQWQGKHGVQMSFIWGQIVAAKI